MQRQSFEETWKFFQSIDVVDPDEPPPTKIGKAQWMWGGSGIGYYKWRNIDDGDETGEHDLLKLENITMPGTFLCRCVLTDLSFRNTELTGSRFCWNDFLDCDFTDADLSLCDLRCSVYERVRFTRADLQKADMRRSDFIDCDFTEARMEGAILTRVQIKELSLSDEQRRAIVCKREMSKLPKGAP